MVELSIGEVARRGGLAVSAVRYYDQRGLLGEVPRRGGQRRFAPSVVRRLALIRAAQEAGFTLGEIKLLLDERADVSLRRQWEALASRRLPELDALIDRLTRLRETVANCLECGCLSLSACGLLHSPGGDGSDDSSDDDSSDDDSSDDDSSDDGGTGGGSRPGDDG